MTQNIAGRQWEAPVVTMLSIRSTANGSGFGMDRWYGAQPFREPQLSPMAPTIESAPATASLPCAEKTMEDQRCWRPPAVTVLTI
jgi:hypothetical protein